MKKWTPEDDAKLSEFWNMGLSGNEIAERLGVTKNSALGRAKRIGLPIHPARRCQYNVRTPIKPHRKDVKEAVTLPGLSALPQAPRARGCEYIAGDPRDGGTMCGAPIKQGSRFSFCAEHHAVCFRSVGAVNA